MRITLVQSGGFAGLQRAHSIDTATLPDEERRSLEQLVERAGFFALPGDPPSAGVQRDRLVFSLTVEQTGRSHTVHVREDAVPPSLAPLVGRLRSGGKQAPGSGGRT